MDFSAKEKELPESPASTKFSKMQSLDISEPIDFKTPIESLGGNKKAFFNML